MSHLSKHFQTNALSYSLVKPSIEAAKSRLTDLADLVDYLTKDLAAGGKFVQAELAVTDAEKTFLRVMFKKYSHWSRTLMTGFQVLLNHFMS